MQIEDHYEIEDLEQAESLQSQGYFTDQTVYNLAKICYCLLYTSPSPRDS